AERSGPTLAEPARPAYASRATVEQWARRLRPGAARPRAEADLLRQSAALSRVIRRDHRIVRGQFPALAIRLGRHVVRRLQMALQHLELLAVLETDDVIGLDGLLDADRRLRARRRRRRGGAD